MSRFPIILLVYSLLALAGWSHSSIARAKATVARYWFTPSSGIPGTLVQVEGMHYFGPNPDGIPIHVGPSSGNGVCDEYRPIGSPIARAYPQNGSWGITIRIPSTLPSGKPITTGTICIMAPSEASSSQPFTILNNKLPGAGQSLGRSTYILMLIGLVLMLLGLQLRGVASILYKSSKDFDRV